ncbi:MAG: hypothetical protein QM783_01425 [Phycisphaerales bacterium]
MNIRRWASRVLSRRSGQRAVVLLFVASLLAVFSAPIWHRHHEEAPGPHDDDCPVCLAIATPTGDGLPDLPVFEPPALGALIRWMGDERLAVLWAGRDRASRGPPMSMV